MTTKLFIHYDGETVECYTHESLVQASIAGNEKRFTNALIAPTMQGQLLAEIGVRAEKPAAEAILAGTYQCPPNTSKCVSFLLTNLRIPPELQGVPCISPIFVASHVNS